MIPDREKETPLGETADVTKETEDLVTVVAREAAPASAQSSNMTRKGYFQKGWRKGRGKGKKGKGFGKIWSGFRPKGRGKGKK